MTEFVTDHEGKFSFTAPSITETPLISVVIAVYNGEDYLDQALKSIRAQTLHDFELIIVNDGSCDRSREIMQWHKDEDNRIGLIEQENIGLTKSLIRAISMSRGKFIARHDADDWSKPERFEKQVELFEKYPDVGFSGTGYYVCSQDGTILFPVCTDVDPMTQLLNKNPFCHGSIMMCREVYEQAGGYRGALPFAQDYDLVLRMGEEKRGFLVPDILYYFRRGADTVSHSKSLQQFRCAVCSRILAKQRIDKGKEDFQSAWQESEEYIAGTQGRVASMVIQGDQYMLSGSTFLALQEYCRALRIAPSLRIGAKIVRLGLFAAFPSIRGRLFS